MATRLFVRSTAAVGSYTVTPAPNHYKNLIGTTFGGGSNGNSVVLAAGASAFSYALNAQFATAIPNYTGAVSGTYTISVGFQTTTPTDVYTKVRVHRATLSGTAYTIVNSSQWSEERLTNKTVQRWDFTINQVDLGTWATTNALIVEYNYRNAGAASITIQPTGGNSYQNAIYTPFDTSAPYGYVNQLQVGQRLYNYSQGGVRGTSRYLKRIANSTSSSGTINNASSGTVTGRSVSTGSATGTQGGSNFSGTVTGVSTSAGTIAAGRQGYKGTITGSATSSGTISAGRQGYTGASAGSSASSGTIAAGVQGYTGSISGSATSNGVIAAGVYGYSGTAIGASTSSGTIAAGLQGYDGSTTGSSTSAGTVHGTPSPQPTPDGVAVPWWYLQQEHQPQPAPRQVLALTGKVTQQATYVTARLRGRPGMTGSAKSTIRVESFITIGAIGYSGQTAFDATSTGKATGKRYIFEDVSDLLVMMGEL